MVCLVASALVWSCERHLCTHRLALSYPIFPLFLLLFLFLSLSRALSLFCVYFSVFLFHRCCFLSSQVIKCLLFSSELIFIPSDRVFGGNTLLKCKDRTDHTIYWLLPQRNHGSRPQLRAILPQIKHVYRGCSNRTGLAHGQTTKHPLHHGRSASGAVAQDAQPKLPDQDPQS